MNTSLNFITHGSAVAGIGGRRFLVPQYEAAANTNHSTDQSQRDHACPNSPLPL